MKNIIVTTEHKSNYPNPLNLSKGTVVKTERKESEWAGWLWCITDDNKGWIPDSYLIIDENETVVIKDYDATELNVEIGDKLGLHYTVNSWGWCETASGQQGWVPLDCVEQAQPMSGGDA